MKLKFQGANFSVTGSRHLLKINGKQILLDCGMYQGHRKDEYKFNKNFPFDPTKVDAVLLSHAHIDHSGNLPNLVKDGFKGSIYTTPATKDLCEFMLRDSAYIQEKEAEYLNRKKAKRGEPLIEPIYTQEDAEKALNQFKGIKYEETFEVIEGVKCTFVDAGHILGSAITILDIQDQEDNKTKRLVYTGDLGRKFLPILRDPYQVKKADYLITESTYGNTLHESIVNVEEIVENFVEKTYQRKGKIIIPSFALGRTQEVVYTFHKLMKDKKIPDMQLYVDSPLAVNVTDIFRKHPECYDERTKKEFQKENPFGFEKITYITDVKDSKALNFKEDPHIIISASGTCEHGRILHHLKNNIEDERNTILIVGYMPEYTLGRKILEKTPEIKIFGEPYKLKAKVKSVNAFSAHADRSDLVDHVKHIEGLKGIFLVHGEEKQLQAFKEALHENSIKDVTIPHLGDEVEI